MSIESELSSSAPENPRAPVDTVTTEALQRIREDGSVMIHDDDGDLIMGAPDIIDVTNLSPVFKRQHLRYIATSIEGAMMDSRRTQAELPVEYLAYWLSPYREHRDFVWDGAGLVLVGPDGYPTGIDADRLWALGGRVE